MPQGPNELDQLFQDPRVAKTREVLWAFTSEDISVPDCFAEPLYALMENDALDAITLAVLLAEPHLRDVADVSDLSKNLPEEVMSALLLVKQDFFGPSTEFIDHILCDNPVVAKIRLARHIADMSDKAKNMVNEDDQVNYFSTCVLSRNLARQIVARNKIDAFPEGLLRHYASELDKHAEEMNALDSDLFHDPDIKITDRLKEAGALLIETIDHDRQRQAEEAAELAKFRAENPFPHPKSPYMLNRGKAKVAFKP